MQPEQGYRPASDAAPSGTSRRTTAAPSTPIGMVSRLARRVSASYFLGRSDRYDGAVQSTRSRRIRHPERSRFLPVSLAEALYTLIPSEERDESADPARHRQAFHDLQRRRAATGSCTRTPVRLGGGHVDGAAVYGRRDPAQLPVRRSPRPWSGRSTFPAKTIRRARSSSISIDKMQSYSLPMQFPERAGARRDSISSAKRISGCLEHCGDRSLDYKPILLTGGRHHGDPRRARTSFRPAQQGGGDHRTARSRTMTRRRRSSLLSLLNMALEHKAFEKSFFHKVI